MRLIISINSPPYECYSIIVSSKNKELRKHQGTIFYRSFLHFETLYLNSGLKRGVLYNLSLVDEL